MQERLGGLTGEEREQFADYTRIMQSMPEYKELAEISLRKIKELKLDALSFMMLALGGNAALLNSKLPYHEAFTLSEHPKIRDIGEKLILIAVTQLANGAELTGPVRGIISTWASWRFFDLRNPKRGRGRPNIAKKEKSFAVWVAYEEKIEKDPRRKREAIIRELEQEFGLKRRRIFAMIDEVDRGLRRKGRYSAPDSQCNKLKN
jgi:hypothetical protein